MPLPGAYFGAVIGFMAGVLLTGTVFGQTSKAGYHGRDGKFKSKDNAVVDKTVYILATTIAGYIAGPFLLDVFTSNPLLGASAVVLILYLGLHHEISSWNLF